MTTATKWTKYDCLQVERRNWSTETAHSLTRQCSIHVTQTMLLKLQETLLPMFHLLTSTFSEHSITSRKKKKFNSQHDIEKVFNDFTANLTPGLYGTGINRLQLRRQNCVDSLNGLSSKLLQWIVRFLVCSNKTNFFKNWPFHTWWPNGKKNWYLTWTIVPKGSFAISRTSWSTLTSGQQSERIIPTFPSIWTLL